MRKKHTKHLKIKSFSIFRLAPANEALGGTDRAIAVPFHIDRGKVTDPCRWRFGRTVYARSQRCQEVRNNIAGPLTFSVSPHRLTTTESDTSE